MQPRKTALRISKFTTKIRTDKRRVREREKLEKRKR